MLIKTVRICRGHKYPGTLPGSQLLTGEHFPFSLQLQVKRVIKIKPLKKLIIGTKQVSILEGK